MKKIRTAVVGLNMGLQHAYAFHSAERADLRWVVDLDEEKAAKLAGELGCKYTSDWLSIMDDIDAVSICTPHHLHADQSILALKAGKHVLLEKPLANTEEDCLRVIKAAEENNTILMMAYVIRFLPIIRKLKDIIITEEFGKPFNANCWIEGFIPPMPGSWLSRKETLGGGVLFSHGCHYIDLLVWLLGKPVKVSTLGTRTGTEWMEGEGTAHSTMLFESGALGYLETSWGMQFAERRALMHIHTPKALLIVSSDLTTLEAVTEKGRQTLMTHNSHTSPGSFVSGEIEHFLDCIEFGKKPETDGHDALKSLRAIWAMYEVIKC
ncbi:Gfo/Idh/MocA family protein [Paenibacillus eucommiae]|uniref:Dehydrogenase n=1 Tax=Paenibacillus eucommiae TaxID=1355755 RepID=A0ABS4J504_9BACL|nr:Gfo/Idh/MocA family oxidoreductase [Paenibacillus eucommiae]MBP1994926.1 putative dehydrogenase [Paenibacillus eucommiae]